MKKEKPIRTPKASDIIADRVRHMIICGDLQPGDSLPSEVQLMEQLGASRRALREALRVLESERFISIRRGARSGAQIHRPDASMVARYAGYVLQAKGVKLEALYTARRAIAPYIARLLAQSGDPEKVARLTAKVEEVRCLFDQGAIRESRELGTRFELTMAELLDNKALTLIYTMIEHLIEAYQLRFPVPPTLTTDDDVEQAVTWWCASAGKLIELLEEREAGAAERHWRLHVLQLEEYWRIDQQEMLRQIIV